MVMRTSCMSMPWKLTLGAPPGSWLWRRIHSIMSSTSCELVVQNFWADRSFAGSPGAPCT